jgi:excisionase family DNA binding protein
MHDQQALKRVKVPEAARILGVSVDTIRRRIRSGTLNAVRKPTRSGHVWLVELPEGYSPDSTVASIPAAGLEALRSEIGDLRLEVRQLRELLERQARASAQPSRPAAATPPAKPATIAPSPGPAAPPPPQKPAATTLPWLQRRPGS